MRIKGTAVAIGALILSMSVSPRAAELDYPSVAILSCKDYIQALGLDDRSDGLKVGHGHRLTMWRAAGSAGSSRSCRRPIVLAAMVGGRHECREIHARRGRERDGRGRASRRGRWRSRRGTPPKETLDRSPHIGVPQGFKLSLQGPTPNRSTIRPSKLQARQPRSLLNKRGHHSTGRSRKSLYASICVTRRGLQSA
jgi:hypothetical protein